MKHKAKGGEKQEFPAHIRFIRRYLPEIGQPPTISISPKSCFTVVWKRSG